MPVTVVVGGQYGSEGKGKTAYYFAREQQAKAVIRVGGPNSGHTVINEKDEAIIFRHLPTASIIKGVKSVLTSGNYINTDILREEVKQSGIEVDDLYIDPFAVIVTEKNILNERTGNLKDSIGSTASGLGSAVKMRIERSKDMVFAKDIDFLKPFLKETNTYLRALLKDGERVIIEGTQGFGLSLLHSNVYPYCTSRDTSASAFISEAGLSPMDVDVVVLVLRAFPIRVGGNSGPLKNETTWEEITRIAKSAMPIQEFTSVTKKLRRIAYFDPDVVKRAISYNQPTKIVLNHCDYLGYESVKDLEEFLVQIEYQIGQEVNYIGLDRKLIIKRDQPYLAMQNLNSSEYAKQSGICENIR